jgi:hypothetical protein
MARLDKGYGLMPGLRCPRSVVEATLAWLQTAGSADRECVVLWLGRRKDCLISIEEPYRPDQTAEADRFHIPPAAMAGLMDHLRATRLIVAAQVHSHPNEAFHSPADDAYAIVRHIAALSFVLPRFALQTTPASFLTDAALYELTEGDLWQEIPSFLIPERCQIVP